MKFSTRGRYALRVMIDLAINANGDYIRLKDISKRQSITIKYLEQIMPLLTKAGYVDSLRGNSGGYKLSMKPEQYCVGDILRVTEGSLAPIPCLEDEPVDCPRAAECTTLPFWTGLYSAIEQYVDGHTLADLIPSANYADGI